MAISMSRNEGGGNAVSNYERPSVAGVGGPYRFYEMDYHTAGPQEWIFLPDVGKVKVAIMFPQPGSAFLEGTCCPPNDITQTISDPLEIFTPAIYPLTEQTQDTLVLLVEGETAIRLNIVGGTTVILAVRC